jgi:DNA-binding beta-propeller fold protein YncE
MSSRRCGWIKVFLMAGSLATSVFAAHTAVAQDEQRHHEHAKRDRKQDAAAAPAPAPSAPAGGVAWYATLHGDGDADQGTGNDNVLGFGSDGSQKSSVLGPATADIGKVHGLRGLLPLADGTLLVISAWKENTMVLQYDRPATDGVRSFVGVFTRGGDANQLLKHPYALAAGPDGAIYASNQDSNTVTRYGGPGTPLAGKPLARDGSADAGSKSTGLVVPSREMAPEGEAHRGIKEVRGIAFGPDGKLYVADRGDGEVSRWDPATGTREATIASKEHGLSTPIQLLFSPDGSALFISDNKENSVFRVSLADGAVTRFIGANAGLDAPSALAIDGDWLYVGSRKGRAVLRFRLPAGTPDAAPFVSGLADNPEYFIRNRN